MQRYVGKTPKIGASIMQVPLMIPELVVEWFIFGLWLAWPEQGWWRWRRYNLSNCSSSFHSSTSSSGMDSPTLRRPTPPLLTLTWKNMKADLMTLPTRTTLSNCCSAHSTLESKRSESVRLLSSPLYKINLYWIQSVCHFRHLCPAVYHPNLKPHKCVYQSSCGVICGFGRIHGCFFLCYQEERGRTFWGKKQHTVD